MRISNIGIEYSQPITLYFYAGPTTHHFCPTFYYCYVFMAICSEIRHPKEIISFIFQYVAHCYFLKHYCPDLELKLKKAFDLIYEIKRQSNKIPSLLKSKLCNQVPSLSLSRWTTLTLLKI